MGVKHAIVPAVLLSVMLLAGCGQQAGTTGPAGSAGSAGSAAAANPAPERTDWQAAAFYERPVSDIVGDLELIGFERTGEDYYDEDPQYASYAVTLTGKPGGIPVEDVSDTVSILLEVMSPSFEEGAEEFDLDTLAEGSAPEYYTITLYRSPVDASGYEELGRGAATAFGLGEVTEATTAPSPFAEGRTLGNYWGTTMFNGTESTWLVTVTEYGADEVPDASAPLEIALSVGGAAE